MLGSFRRRHCCLDGAGRERRGFYRSGNRWFSVRIRTAPRLQWDAPHLRFETDFIDTPGRSYDVSSDGKRLLVVKRTEPDIRTRIDLVLNWTAALPR